MGSDCCANIYIFDLRLNRKGACLYARKQLFGHLILLVIIWFGKLGLVHQSVLGWIRGLDANGDIYYLLFVLTNSIMLGFFHSKILESLV